MIDNILLYYVLMSEHVKYIPFEFIKNNLDYLLMYMFMSAMYCVYMHTFHSAHICIVFNNVKCVHYFYHQVNFIIITY